MADSNAPILEITGLRRRYGKTEALCGIDFSVIGPGVFGLLGPNGAGKTTTIKIIAGLIRPTAGQVRIAGFDVQASRVDALRHIAVMLETPHFYEYLSARDNLRVLAKLSGNGSESRIAELLARVGLASKSQDRVSSYSRGMRQRLGLAASLLSDPKLLILDEPTNGLDPAGIVSVRQWLTEMAGREGRTVLLSSHQMGEVERICKTVTIINEGRIIASGPTDELIRGKDSIIVRTSDSRTAEAVLRELGGIGDLTVQEDGSLRIEAGSLSSQEINRALVKRDIEVIAISEERETLEESFFRLVGRGNDVG
jgi:ABC-2 type transport system ATP-binding protein